MSCLFLIGDGGLIPETI